MRLVYNKLLGWVKNRFFKSRVTDSLTHTFTMDYFTTEDKPEEPKLTKAVQFYNGSLFEYIGSNSYDTYKVKFVNPFYDLHFGIVEAIRIGDGKKIVLSCGRDGRYYGKLPIYNVGVFKPVKEIKKFRLC